MNKFDFDFCKKSDSRDTKMYYPTISSSEFTERYPQIKTLNIELFHIILSDPEEEYPTREYPIVLKYQEITEKEYPKNISCPVGYGGTIMLSFYLTKMIDDKIEQMDFNDKCRGTIIPEKDLKKKRLNRSLYPACNSEIIGRIKIEYI